MGLIDKILKAFRPADIPNQNDSIIQAMKTEREALIFALKESARKNDDQIAAIRKAAIEIVAAKNLHKKDDQWDTLITQGDVITDGAGEGSGANLNFSFKAKRTGGLNFTVQPGSAEIAPDTIIGVTCSTTQAATAGSTYWCGWIDVDSTAGTAIAYFGAAWPAPLNSTQKLTIRRRRVVEMNIVDDQIRNIKNLQCGDVDVFDPANVPAPDDLTIELNATNGDAIEGMLQIVDADTLTAGRVSIPTMAGPNTGDDPQSLEWVELDSTIPEDANPFKAGSSLETIAVSGGKKALQLGGFKEGVEASPTDDYKIMLRGASANASAKPWPAYAGKETAKAWLGIVDEKVKVSEGDTAAGYLSGLITAGTTNVHLQATDGNLAISVDEVSGPSGTVTVGTTTTGEPGTSASVVNSGTDTAAILDFTIPRGVDGTNGTDGTNGSDGLAATVNVGTTTTGDPGTSASVTNSGTESAAILNFTIPRGADGTNGIDGINGTNGTNGTDGIVSIIVLWDGGTCRPALVAGNFWYLSNVTLVDHVQTFYMVQTCLPTHDVPGYCPVSTAGSPLSAVDVNGDPIYLNLINGLIDVAAYPDMIGKVIGGIDPVTGDQAQGTVQADGTITGYDGAIRILNPATGDSGLYRLDSGILKG